MSQRRFYVYMLATRRDGPLYVGVTSDLQRRLHEHKTHVVRGHTWRYNIDKLVYLEEFETSLEAIAREKRLKRWRRVWKIALIEAGNPDWADLSGSFVT